MLRRAVLRRAALRLAVLSVGFLSIGLVSLGILSLGIVSGDVLPGAVLSVGTATASRVALLPAAVPADPLPIPEPTPAEANARADEILSRPEYRPPAESLQQKVTRWLSERIGGLLERMVSGGGSSVIGWFVIAVLVALVGFMVWRIIATMSRTASRPDEGVAELEIDERRPASDWRLEAERREAEGDWKAALLCRYRALVADLVERGVLASVPGRTTGEFRMDVAAGEPSVADEFSGASGLFDGVWYGNLPTDASDNTRFRELADRVVSGVDR